PTDDGTSCATTRGTPAGPNLCLRDNNCDTPTGATGPGGIPVVPNPGRTGGNQDSGGGAGFGPSGFRFHLPDATTLTRIVGVLLALLLVLAALVARYLRPRSVAGVRKRTLVLARLAGAEVHPGETPLELSRRLSRAFPEAASSVRDLASGFVVAAYAPPDVAQSTRSSLMQGGASGSVNGFSPADIAKANAELNKKYPGGKITIVTEGDESGALITIPFKNEKDAFAFMTQPSELNPSGATSGTTPPSINL